MPFQPIEAEKLSGTIKRQIEKLMLHGVLKPGERLPAERDLAERLGVSRPSLRDAIAALEEQGLLNRRAGSGIYVADFHGQAFSQPLMDLFARHDDAIFDYIAFRRDLEGMAAARAAEMASDTDLKVIDTFYTRMAAAQAKGDLDGEMRMDAEFHLAIMEASHNVVMLHMMRAMFAMLRQGIFYNRQAMFDESNLVPAMLGQHRAINQALQNRDADGARSAMNAHLNYIAESLRKAAKKQANEEVAAMKFTRETDVT